MSSAPWSVKGIDPKAREIAKDLARRSGMTLGEWINQMILEDGVETEVVDEAPAPPRVAAPIPARPPTESRPPRRPGGGDDLDRVLAALDGLSARLETSERRQAETAARFDAALGDLRADQARAASRAQSAEQTAGGAGRVESLRALEGALNKVAGHLQDGERRSRESMAVLRNEMSQEVQRVAEQMNQKVQAVENRSADAIAQVGAEVTRVASVVEQRLRRADDAQAEALEKLGAEIARITERLSERIAAAERRSAQAIDDVGEQMARVTDRIHQRQERTSSELAERMRQSEERTAKLLEDAREKIERRLGKLSATDEPAPPTVAEASGAPASIFAARWKSEPTAAPQEPPVQAPPPAPQPAFLEPPSLIVEPAATPAPAPPQAAAEPQPAFTPQDVAAALAVPPDIDLESYLTADVGHDILFVDRDAKRDVPAPAPALVSDEPADAVGPLDEVNSLRPSTRELIAAARAAARVNVEEPGAFRTSAVADETDSDIMFSASIQRKPRMAGGMRGVLLTSGAVASIGLAATGYVVMHPEVAGQLSKVLSPMSAKPIPVGPASTAATPAPTQALNLTTDAKPAEPAPTDAEALFNQAVAKVDVGDPSGVAPLRTAANLGWAPAQRRLGKLYEDGGAGVEKDPAEGRRWTQRAATNGDPRGMHNLGLDYYEGVGGPKNLAVAAQWFGRAAELGLRDSQYNLARFYEAGLGVKQDLSAAYKWYLIAGRAGDTEAAARGESLKAQLNPTQRAAIEQSALTFQPDKPPAPQSLTASLRASSPEQLALAQRALAKLGYYQGANDGAPSQNLGQAIQAYQRDRGLAANGTLSPELMQTFANVSR